MIAEYFSTPSSLKAQKQSGIHFGGVYSNDEFAQKFRKGMPPNRVFIINLKNLNEGGSHWVALTSDGHYMDSYGCPPTKEIAPFVRTFNTSTFQPYNQESCGYYSLYFADQVIHQRDPGENLIDEEHTHNERTLRDYFF